MKRLLMALGFLTLGGSAFASGGFTGVYVNTGTVTQISTYQNPDGGNRQAIVVGDRVSSTTLTVDPLIGVTVNLGTSSAAGIGSLSAGSAGIGTINNSSFSVVASTLQVQVLGTVPAQVVTSTLQVQVAGTVPSQVVTSTLQVQVAGTVPVSVATPYQVFFSSFGANASTTAVSVLGTPPVQVVTSTLQVQVAGTVPISGPVALSAGGAGIGLINNSSFTVSGSTLQVQILGTVPVSGASAAPLSILSVSGSSPTVGYQGTISSVPVAIQGTASVQVVTSTLQVQVVGTVPVSATLTSGPLSILSVSGSSPTVGYQGTISSVPVSIQGTPTVTANQGTLAFNIVSTNTLNVSGSAGGGIIQMLNVSGSTQTIGYQGATVSSVPVNVIGGNISVVTSTLQVQVLGTVPISGSITSNSVNVTTGVWDAVLVGTGVAIAGVNPSGYAQAFGVDTSSDINVDVVRSTLQVQVAGTVPISGPIALSAGAAGIGLINNSSFTVSGSTLQVQVLGTVPVNGSATGTFPSPIQIFNTAGSTITVGYGTTVASVPVSLQGTGNVAVVASTLQVQVAGTVPVSATVTAVDVTTAAWNTTIAGIGAAIGGVGSSGNFQAFSVNASSQVYAQVVASTVGVVGTLADNGAAAGTNRLPVLPSIYQTDYLAGTAATQGRNGASSQGTDGLTWVTSPPAIRPASYSASTSAIASAASATDIAAICGNAVNTVLVYGIQVSCTETTAGNINLNIVRRSTAYTGAWSTMTSVSDDPSAYNVHASTVAIFTANPTVGTYVGDVNDYKLGCMATGTATPNDIYLSPPDWRMKPKVLVGATQCIAVDLNSTTVTGGSFSVGFDYMETANITP